MKNYKEWYPQRGLNKIGVAFHKREWLIGFEWKPVGIHQAGDPLGTHGYVGIYLGPFALFLRWK
jgi:hypothetical protein